MGPRIDWKPSSVDSHGSDHDDSGQIFGERTTSVTSAIGLLGILIMLFASRKAAAQRTRK
jgi:hypothetical protein